MARFYLVRTRVNAPSAGAVAEQAYHEYPAPWQAEGGWQLDGFFHRKNEAHPLRESAGDSNSRGYSHKAVPETTNRYCPIIAFC
jgi:hypothetical protein